MGASLLALAKSIYYFALKIQTIQVYYYLTLWNKRNLIFNFLVNRNWKISSDSRKRAKILADNRKSHHPIETLLIRTPHYYVQFDILWSSCFESYGPKYTR